MYHRLIQAALTATAALALCACGGGGGGGGGAGTLPMAWTSPPPAAAPAASVVLPGEPSNSATSTVVTLSGLAVTGAPVAHAAVSVRCIGGTAVGGSTDSDGAWKVSLTDPAFPCLVTVSGGNLAATEALYALALSSANLNVTPLTGLIVASAAQAAPAALASNAASALTAAAQALAQGRSRVDASLQASGYSPLASDPLTTPFKAVAGDAHDDLIATLMRSLADENMGYDTLLATLAGAGAKAVPIPLTHVFTAAELAAMPTLNKASMSATGGELTMTLDGGAPSAVGAFVGGGTGNKAVLQLPGLAGTRLIDFKDMTLELQSGAGPYVPYVNFFVDLTCDATPLSPTATIADVQKRRRVVIYDPSHTFVDVGHAISSTQFSPVKFDYTTPGWRVSAGDPLGADLAVTDYSGTRDFTSFDFTKYPDACIVDGISADNGMFREAACQSTSGLPGTAPASCGKAHSGAIVVLGGSTNFDPTTYKVKKVRYNGANARNFSFQ